MTAQTITASAPGKIHFLGEHTAVYNKPAILAAIDKRCTVTLVPSEGAGIRLSSINFHKTIRLSWKEVLDIRDEAQAQWKIYRKTNDVSILKGIVRNEMMYPVVAIGETLRYFKKDPQTGFDLTIDSEIPLGSGHGSSAAVAVSIVGAVTMFLDQPIDKEIISKIAILVEQTKHGNPSYGDIGSVVNGGLIWFQKETPDKIIIKPLDFSVPKKLSDKLLIIQTGEPEESTGEMVHAVSEYKKTHATLFDEILNDQEALTRSLLEAIKTANESDFSKIIKEGEANLETLGVVSESTKALIREIENAGGAAKICGAGGRKKGSGIILAFHKNKRVLQPLAKALPYYSIRFGVKGLEVQ
jgi:mevalonate kinase